MLVLAILQTIWASLKWVINAVYKHVKTLAKKSLQYLLYIGSPSLRTQQGFILPTTVLLLLVVTLAVGSITLRTLNRTGQVASDRQQRVIYNAATPALERAKAKLEFLFDNQRDTRYPNGVPDQDFLYGMMRNDGVSGGVALLEPFGPDIDPYTFPDEKGNYDTEEAETRIDIGGPDGEPDNAWKYRVDLDEDGTLDATVAYSILFNKPSDSSENSLTNASDDAVGKRAAALQVRHGPLSVPVQDNGCGSGSGSATVGDDGWSKPEAGGATLYKNFQVNALVIPDKDESTVATLEFHQDRKIDEGNKWGAWFRNDLEIFPGAKFNWNGAMHTEGNFIVGNSNVEAYLISSPASCYYSREDSEITVADRSTALQSNDFEGQFLSTRTVDNKWTDSDKSTIHLFNPQGEITPDYKPVLNKDNDSTKNAGSDALPNEYLLDPVVLLTQDISKARGFESANAANDGNPAPGRDDKWTPEKSKFLEERRLYNKTETTPSVDDSFRADNRYGPKPRINGKDIPGKIGETIVGDRLSGQGVTDDDLTRLGPGAEDEPGNYNNVGLDGYWERRARAEGLRVIVGQRLELGDTFGWGGTKKDGTNYTEPDATNNEPLMPWNGCTDENSNNSGLCAQSRQRRSLRDNLAAVQAATVYHANATGVDKDFPVACLASTVHPGTPFTLQKSATFLNWLKGLDGSDNITNFWPSGDQPDLFISDFFRGEGTNGWEYETPSGGSPATFASDLASTQPLGKALRNLAHYAGDPFGGAPSFTPQQDTMVHPYPLLSMWGDFSVLRNIFDQELDDGVSYANLSPADKTTLQTAACSLGMLANELYYLEKFDYTQDVKRKPLGSSSTAVSYLDILNARLVALMVNKNGKSQTQYETEIDSLLNPPTDPHPNWRDYWQEPPLDLGSASGGHNESSGPYKYYDNANNFKNQDDFDGLKDKNAPPEAYIARLEQWRDADIIAIQRTDKGTDGHLKYFAVDDDLINLAKIIMLREQTIRDRSWGFLSIPVSYSPMCQSNSILRSNAYGPFSDQLLKREGLKRLCSPTSKFGVLHSLFPGENLLSKNNSIDAGDNHAETAQARPGTDSDRSTITSKFNPGYKYVAITASDLAAIKLKPREVADWKLPHGGFGTVAETGSNYTKATPNDSSQLYVVCSQDFCNSSGEGLPSQTVASSHVTRRLPVAFKDASLYNGRELMSVRVMDMNLDMLRNDATGLSNSDRWLPNAGIVYAFREDATREDAITRPSGSRWTDCNTDASYANGPSDCHMSSFAEEAKASTDPPLKAENAISPKPVDYAPDPDRRPSGFRLINGEKLQRPGDEGRGLSLITDNAAYIKGDFNLHQNSVGTLLEEFDDYLMYSGAANAFNDFYKRKSRNNQFATVTGDEWRPSEILADAITILSDNFCDGSIFDSFHSVAKKAQDIQVDPEDSSNNRKIQAFNGSSVTSIKAPWRSLYNCPDTGASKEKTSYTNGFFPKQDITLTSHKLQKIDSLSGLEEYWHHENPYDTTSPYTITRQGNPRLPQSAAPYSSEYFVITDTSLSERPSQSISTAVNAIIISGSVPSRPGQAYGGLHNFPRFIERWQGRDLRISGSLMQLNFSHTSTAPYDQDAWQPGDKGNPDKENIDYYWAPNRLWGYDVGLQKGVAGPMARRFTSGAEPTRSEFYSEPPADDPYIYNLCQAIKGAANCPQS